MCLRQALHTQQGESALKCGMEQVMELMAKKRYREALVSLWHLAGNTTNVNAWERRHNQAEIAKSAKTLLATLLAGKPFDAKSAMSNPLALIEALDEFVAQRFTARRMPPIGVMSVQGTRYWIVVDKIGARLRTRLRNKRNDRVRWFRHHIMLPCKADQFGIGLEFLKQASAPKLFENDKTTLRLMLVEFCDHVRPDWKVTPGNNMLTADALTHGKHATSRNTDPNALRAHRIFESLEVARDNGVDVVVMPELAVTPAVRQKIATWLRETDAHGISLVAAGSFHETDAADGKRYNIARLFDQYGDTVITHRKLKPLGTLATGLSTGDHAGEDIDVGRTMTLLSTPIGLLALPICLDFCDAGEAIRKLWLEIFADWLLVPAMGDDSSMRAHDRAAQLEADYYQGAVVLLANVATEGDTMHAYDDPFGQDTKRGFVFAPRGHANLPNSAIGGQKLAFQGNGIYELTLHRGSVA